MNTRTAVFALLLAQATFAENPYQGDIDFATPGDNPEVSQLLDRIGCPAELVHSWRLFPEGLMRNAERETIKIWFVGGWSMVSEYGVEVVRIDVLDDDVVIRLFSVSDKGGKEEAKISSKAQKLTPADQILNVKNVFVRPDPVSRTHWSAKNRFPALIFERMTSDGEYQWAIRMSGRCEMVDYFSAFEVANGIRAPFEALVGPPPLHID